MKKISVSFTILSLLLIGSNILVADMLNHNSYRIYKGDRIIDSNNLTNEDLKLSNDIQYNLPPIVVAPKDTIGTSAYDINEWPRANNLRDDYDRRQPELEYRQDMHRSVEDSDRGIERRGRR